MAGGGALPKRDRCPVLNSHIMMLIKLNDNINEEGQMEEDITATWPQPGLGNGFANV